MTPDSKKWEHQITTFDERRDIVVPNDKNGTVQFCIRHFIDLSEKAIADHGYFAAALSGGSTPKAIFQGLASPEIKNRLQWDKFKLFWSDERSVPPGNPESNYRMAMEAGLDSMPIPKEKIFRMAAEKDIEENAKKYEQLIKSEVKDCRFDLVMLGMGEDGHTASLFPRTHALHTKDRLVVANYVPQKNTWRMTFTYACINSATHIAIYVLGSNKAEMVHKIFSSPYDPDGLPIQRIGTPAHKALWIMDADAAQHLLKFYQCQLNTD